MEKKLEVVHRCLFSLCIEFHIVPLKDIIISAKIIIGLDQAMRVMKGKLLVLLLFKFTSSFEVLCQLLEVILNFYVLIPPFFSFLVYGRSTCLIWLNRLLFFNTRQ